MADYVTKIRTEHGDKQIDYNALANLPDLSYVAEHTHTPESIGASPAEHVHIQNEITDFPTSLPANGGNADTVDNMHASDFASATEFGQLKTQVENISLESLGVTVNVETISYLDGASSNIQEQLDGKSNAEHNHNASEITEGVLAEDRIPVVSMIKGGTEASDGATGLANLFASGPTVLSSYQYGNELPTDAPVGVLFFKKVKVSS